MTAGLYGLLAALAWGGADFIARFTGRSIGYQQALFGMLSIGAILTTLVIFLADIPLVFVISGWWLLLVAGIGTMFSTLLLYWGLARGPVTIVAPIVGSFPVFNVFLNVFLGSRLENIQWLACFAVLIGVWIVARASAQFATQLNYTKQHLRKTIFIALASSLGFGVTVEAMQTASLIYGELQTVCITRWISLLPIGLLFLYKKQLPKIKLNYLPLIGLQSFMDTGAFVALAWSAQVENAEIATVTSSSFSIVTILLARYFLKEQVSLVQWSGVFIIFIGVVLLSSFEYLMG